MDEKQVVNIWEDTPIKGCFSEEAMAETDRRIKAKFKYMSTIFLSQARKIPSRLKGCIDG